MLKNKFFIQIQFLLLSQKFISIIINIHVLFLDLFMILLKLNFLIYSQKSF